MKTKKPTPSKKSSGASPKLRAKLPGMTYSVHALAFAPDSSLLASGRHAGGEMLWRTKDFKPAHTLAAPADGICGGLAFSTDGRLLVSCDTSSATLWEVKSGKRLRELPVKGTIRDVAFSPDGKRVAGAMGKAIVLWDTASGAVVTRVEQKAITEEVAFLPDGRLIAQAGKALLMIDPSSGKVLFTIDHKASIMATEIAPDGRTLLTAGDKHHTRLWDAKTGGAGPVLADPDEEMLFHAKFSPDGKSVLTMNGEGSVRLWDIASGKVRATWTGGDDGIEAGARFAPDGRHIAVQFDELHLINLTTGDVVAKLPFIADENCLAFSPNGKFLAAGSDEALMVWEI